MDIISYKWTTACVGIDQGYQLMLNVICMVWPTSSLKLKIKLEDALKLKSKLGMEHMSELINFA